MMLSPLGDFGSISINAADGGVESASTQDFSSVNKSSSDIASLRVNDSFYSLAASSHPTSLVCHLSFLLLLKDGCTITFPE